MIFLWIFLGILMLLSLLSLLKANLILEYREDVSLTLRILCFRYPLYPSQKKKVRPQKQKKKPKKQDKKQPSTKEAPKKEKGILEKLGTLRELLSVLLERTLGHLRIRTARIRLRVATGDAASTAVLFGAVNGAVSLLLETLDHFDKLEISRGDEIEILPDYLAEKTTADIRLLFTLRVWHILDILLKAFVTYTQTKKQKVKS